jgi:hypothetical protein
MKPGYFLILISIVPLALIYIGCSKSNTNKHPKITLVSIDRVVDTGGTMTALLNFDNSGGSLSNGTFVSIRTRHNQRPPLNPSADTIRAQIANFNGASKGQFQFQLFENQGLSTQSSEPDTFTFQFFAFTPDSNYSDTITTPQVVVF